MKNCQILWPYAINLTPKENSAISFLRETSLAAELFGGAGDPLIGESEFSEHVTKGSDSGYNNECAADSKLPSRRERSRSRSVSDIARLQQLRRSPDLSFLGFRTETSWSAAHSLACKAKFSGSDQDSSAPFKQYSPLLKSTS